ncbi:GGDEF domain-containing protein [Agarivorans sp. MS3-6]
MDKVGRMGEFTNPMMEMAFRKKEWEQLKQRMIFASFAGGLAYFFAIIGDVMVTNSESMLRDLLIMRSSVLLIALAVGVCGFFLKEYTTLLNKIICGLLFFVLLGESAELTIKAELFEYVGIPGVSILVLLFYLSFPPRFISVLAVCLTGSSLYLFTCALLGYASVNYIYTSLLFLLVVNGFGAYVYLQFSILRRREYSALEELKKNAEIDALTQVYNRRKVLELGDGEIGKANNFGHQYSVIMIDVDNFKSVNDIYGHAVGDQVLLEVATRCRKLLREDDIFGRFGGEEFVVFLPRTNINTALVIGERLLSEISSAPFETNKGSLLVTMSLGVAALTAAKEAPRKLLEMADEALYEAKKTGRNKVCTTHQVAKSSNMVLPNTPIAAL